MLRIPWTSRGSKTSPKSVIEDGMAGSAGCTSSGSLRARLLAKHRGAGVVGDLEGVCECSVAEEIADEAFGSRPLHALLAELDALVVSAHGVGLVEPVDEEQDPGDRQGERPIGVVQQVGRHLEQALRSGVELTAEQLAEQGGAQVPFDRGYVTTQRREPSARSRSGWWGRGGDRSEELGRLLDLTVLDEHARDLARQLLGLLDLGGSRDSTGTFDSRQGLPRPALPEEHRRVCELDERARLTRCLLGRQPAGLVDQRATRSDGLGRPEAGAGDDQLGQVVGESRWTERIRWA